MLFSFLKPYAFLLLLLVPIFFALRKLRLLSKIDFPLAFVDWSENGTKQLGVVESKAFFIAEKFSSGLALAAFLLVVVAAAEPVSHKQQRVYTSRGTDVLFVMDTSPSMAARDINSMTRLDAAKFAVNTLVQNNPGASYGLVAMASEAAIVVPATADIEFFKSRLEALRLGELGEGSAIGNGLASALYHLSESKAVKKCVVLFTDGENNAGEINPETAERIAFENDIIIYTVGIGTRGSVPVDYKDPFTGKSYSGYLDSSFDSAQLEKIALGSGGRYYGVESIASLSQALSAIINRQNVVQSYYLKNTDTFHYGRLLFAAGICFVLAWIVRRIFLGVLYE